MKTLIRPSFLAASCLLAVACGDSGRPAPSVAPTPPAPDAVATAAANGTVYGAPLDQVEIVSIADVVARSAELDGRNVRVEGMVIGVCAKRGCWIEIGGETGPDSIVFKVQDGVMVFPMGAKGQWAVADGTVRRIPMTLEETRDQLAAEAEEAGRPFDPAAVTEPLTLVRLDGLGARLRDRK